MNHSGKGGFVKGRSGNPRGRPRGNQSFIDRAVYLLDNLTVREILDHANYVELPTDKNSVTEEMLAKHKSTMRMPARDLVIIMHIADSFNLDGGKRFDKLLDRILPKNNSPLIINQRKSESLNTHYSVSEVDQWIADAVEKAENSSNKER